jgi:hypothetical protein
MGRFLILAAMGWGLLAQPPAAAPVATFGLKLEQQIGSGASVSFFVARESHLYFVSSGSGSTVVIQTDLKGTIENWIPRGTERVAGIDVDDEGNLYVLSENSWLTVFSPNGGIRRTLHLEPRVIAFAVVGGKVMVADENDRLHFLETEQAGFTLSAYPRPWKLFGFGANKLGIWRPQGPTLGVLPTDEGAQDGLSTRGLGPAETAAGDSQERLYLLSAEKQAGIVEIQEFDDHFRPNRMGRYTLPEGFRAQMMGVTGGKIYLVSAAGKVAVYAPGVGVLADSPPALLGNLDLVMEAVRGTGYQGHFEIRMVVGTDGVPQGIEIQTPASLVNHPGVIAAVQALRYRPQIRGGRAIVGAVRIDGAGQEPDGGVRRSPGGLPH